MPDHITPPDPDTNYTYFAFISYKRGDEKWARWLKRNLQRFRLPARTRRRYPDMERRCSPVFLDRTNLIPGVLDSRLSSEVQSARYLIVICSRKAKENSKYLDDELRYFLEGTGDLSRVIPLIVDRSSRPVEECFPAALAECCREKNIVGVSVYDDGKRSALLRIIAAMLGIRREELESDDARRRRRNAFTAGALLSLMLVCGIWYWDYSREKTEYYLDYTEVYGVPKGLGKLDRDEIQEMRAHYALISRKNRVIELRYESADGQILSHNACVFDEWVNRGTLRTDRPSRAIYSYTDSDELSRIILYTCSDSPILVLDYDSVGSARVSAYENRMFPDYVREYLKLAADCREMIRYQIIYDENGHTAEIRYCSLSPAGLFSSCLDSSEIGSLSFLHDELGRVIRTDYSYGYAPEEYESVLSLRTKLEKNSEIEAAHSGDVWHVEYCYDDRGDLTEIRYLDRSGRLITSEYGYALSRITYDDSHNVIGLSFFDPDGNPVNSVRGAASFVPGYDEHHRLISAESFDADGILLSRAQFAGDGSLIPDYSSLG